MITEQCKTCSYFDGHQCDRCINAGMCGASDTMASRLIKQEGDICQYRREGKPSPRPNYCCCSNEWAS